MELSLEGYLAVNFFVTAALLALSVRRIGFVRMKPLLIAAAVSALGAALIQAGELPAFPFAPGFMVLSLGVAMGRRRAVERLRGALWCALWTLALAGGAALAERMVGQRMWIAPAVCLPLMLAGFFLPDGGREGPREGEVRLRIATRMGETEVLAMVDTGNRLREPFSGLPVLIVSGECLTGILDPVCLDERSALPPGFRLVRYRALGGGGCLRCFRPESLSCLRRARWIDAPDMWVAIYGGRIPGSLDALAPPAVGEAMMCRR